jgi:aryl-alcohol dehydrogenase-like predicted oxidoreductase
VLDLLFEYGVNHIDTAPRYGDAELRIGPCNSTRSSIPTSGSRRSRPAAPWTRYCRRARRGSSALSA